MAEESKEIIGNGRGKNVRCRRCRHVHKKQLKELLVAYIWTAVGGAIKTNESKRTNENLASPTTGRRAEE
jgi:Zn-finger protein